jgi:hypothetical protein
MNQSFETQLAVALRALGEVVLPALDGAEKHVVEQLHLTMAVLEFMRQRLPQAGPFYRRDLIDHAMLADASADLIAPYDAARAGDLRALVDAGRAVLDHPAADWNDYIAATRRLRAATAEAAERSGGAPYEAALDTLILDTSAGMHLQARTWYLPFGFEPDPDLLPPLA